MMESWDTKGFFLKNSAWFWPDFTIFNQCITSVLYFLTCLSLFSWDPIFLNLWDKLARLLAHLPRMSRLDTWCHIHSLSENISKRLAVLILNRLILYGMMVVIMCSDNVGAGENDAENASDGHIFCTYHSPYWMKILELVPSILQS